MSELSDKIELIENKAYWWNVIANRADELGLITLPVGEIGAPSDLICDALQELADRRAKDIKIIFPPMVEGQHAWEVPGLGVFSPTQGGGGSGEKCQGCGADVEAHTDTGLRFCEEMNSDDYAEKQPWTTREYTLGDDCTLEQAINRAKDLGMSTPGFELEIQQALRARDEREKLFDNLRSQMIGNRLLKHDVTDQATWVAIRNILNEHAKSKEFDTYLQGHQIPSSKV